MMKNAILIISTLVIFALFGFGIYQKEQILNEGDVILLKVQPVDPRSLMAGDYMNFRYTILEALDQSVTAQKHGFLVIKADNDNVAEFVRFFNGERLSTNEKLLKYSYSPSNHKFYIKPDSFHFQEGLQPLYQKAQYAIFHYHGSKSYLLVGLADANGNEIKSNENINAE